MLPAVRDLAVHGLRVRAGGAVATPALGWMLAPSLVLVGVLALRAWVTFTAQA